MIKYYCDRCGAEMNRCELDLLPMMETDEFEAANVSFRMRRARTEISPILTEDEVAKYKVIPKLLCKKCKDSFLEWCRGDE